MSSNAAESLVKIKDANRRASLNPSDNLKSKFNSAISHLLAGGAYSRIVKTLLYIGTVMLLLLFLLASSSLFGARSFLSSEEL